MWSHQHGGRIQLHHPIHPWIFCLEPCLRQRRHLQNEQSQRSFINVALIAIVLESACRREQINLLRNFFVVEVRNLFFHAVSLVPFNFYIWYEFLTCSKFSRFRNCHQGKSYECLGRYCQLRGIQQHQQP
jgi:hypothetical protein